MHLGKRFTQAEQLKQRADIYIFVSMLTRFTKQTSAKYAVGTSAAAEGSSSSPDDEAQNAKDKPLAAANEPEFQPLLDDVPVFAGTRADPRDSNRSFHW